MATTVYQSAQLFTPKQRVWLTDENGAPLWEATVMRVFTMGHPIYGIAVAVQPDALAYSIIVPVEQVVKMD